MNRGSFLKGLLGLGAVAASTKTVVSKPKNTFASIEKRIDKIACKIHNAFIKKDKSLVSEDDFNELSEAYDLFLDEFLTEDGKGNDITFNKGAYSKIKYYLLNDDIKSSDASFMKHFGNFHKMIRLHFNNEKDYKHAYAHLHKHYATHLLYMGYVAKAKTRINNFKQFCNDYALSKLEDKRIWLSVELDNYKGDYKFRDKFGCSNYSI